MATSATRKPAPKPSKLAKKPAVAQKTGKNGAPKSIERAPRGPAQAPQTLAAPEPVKRRRADWEAIERDYRTGKFTDQELADKHGNVVSRQAITKMAKVRHWQKDLSDAVRKATNAKLIAAEAEKKVAEQVAKGCEATVDAVLAAAELNKQVILSHREDLKAARGLTSAMLNELQQVSVNPGKLRDLLEVLTGGEDMTAAQVADARAALADLQRLPSRILSVQRLATAMARLQTMERTAYGLDNPEQPPPVDELADLSDEELDARINERLARLKV
jgi:hypothetical protein